MPRAERFVVSASQSQTIAATTEVVLTRSTQGVHANASGNLIVTLAGDSTPTTFVVVQGVTYPLAVIQFEATNAVQCIALFSVPEQ
jgi:ethanolamine utilization microcompartment shell protein EutL